MRIDFTVTPTTPIEIGFHASEIFITIITIHNLAIISVTLSHFKLM